VPSFDVDGTTIAYEIHGGGEPLLLVAGQASDRRMWEPVLEDFAARHTAIVWDHRGTGDSDKPKSPPYSTEGFAADAIALLDHLGIPKAHAYGISMGGRIVQWLGISHPDRVGALVLGATTPGNAHGVARPADVDAGMAERPEDPEQLHRFWADLLVSPAYVEAHPDYLVRMREQFADPIPGYAQRQHYLASEAHDTWDRLPEITAPTLVIHGDEDLVNMTANAALLADRIPGAALHLVKGGRHGYFVEFREESSVVVLDFLAAHPLSLT
jgi:pimeloyl-ACP methyl ester carboxylesterase